MTMEIVFGTRRFSFLFSHGIQYISPSITLPNRKISLLICCMRTFQDQRDTSSKRKWLLSSYKFPSVKMAVKILPPGLACTMSDQPTSLHVLNPFSPHALLLVVGVIQELRTSPRIGRNYGLSKHQTKRTFFCGVWLTIACP
jgi:hypothetical protein